MKIFTTILLTLFITYTSIAQQSEADSLRHVLNTATHDSTRLFATRSLVAYFEVLNIDSTLFYAAKGLIIARKNRQQLSEAFLLNNQAFVLINKGDFAAALKNILQSLKILQNPASEKNTWVRGNVTATKNRLRRLDYAYFVYGLLMIGTENTEQAIFQFKESIRASLETENYFRIGLASSVIADQYLKLNIIDSAETYAQKSLKLFEQIKEKKFFSIPNYILGDIYVKQKKYELAKKYYHRSLQAAYRQEDINRNSLAQVNQKLSLFYQIAKEGDSALYYAKKEFEIVSEPGMISSDFFKNGDVYQDLYQSYLLNNEMDSAFKYQGLALTTKDAWNKEKIKNLAAFQNLSLSEALRLRDLEKKRIESQSNIRTGAFLIGLAVLSIIGFILYRNNKQKQKANKVLETTLASLKSTQCQLIQSEKMASLGELTAGIAHEIQNPLNFVNNFAEVSNEMIQEIKEERAKKKEERDEALQDELLKDIAGNLQKINHHGKRADAIVKGMLQHSRSSSGTKEPTDINALADEYLRLAYHGLRAKDKSFNATIKTDFDTSLEKVNIIPQDIGKVVLNLLTNAFYVVNEKNSLRQAPKQIRTQQDENYEPTVSISTKKVGDSVLISINDNGNGIPQNIVDKIFQPFFTTKPTGQGTGLGLSLSYDIIKAHGGELKVETKEGEGSVFIISLPIS